MGEAAARPDDGTTAGPDAAGARDFKRLGRRALIRREREDRAHVERTWRRVRSIFYKDGDPVSQMHIWLDDPTLADDLCAHYRRSGFHAERVDGGRVAVALADAPSREQERLEVLLHLRVWEAVNPNARGELLP